MASPRCTIFPTAAAPVDAVYAKTDAGRELLAAARSRLGLRDRQILLLCTGERDAVTLERFFGPGTPAVLERLIAAGLIQAVPRAHEDWPEPAFAPTLPPLDYGIDRSANQSGFLPTNPGTDDSAAFSQAYTRACVMLVELGGPAAEQLLYGSLGLWKDDDVLAHLARTLGLAQAEKGPEQAGAWANELARLLPRAAVPRLVDALVEAGEGVLAMALYEAQLSDTDTGEG